MAENYSAIARTLVRDARVGDSEWVSKACEQAASNLWAHKCFSSTKLWCETEHLHEFVRFECELSGVKCGKFVIPVPQAVERIRWGYMKGLHKQRR